MKYSEISAKLRYPACCWQESHGLKAE